MQPGLMLGNLLGPIERALGAAMAPGEKGAKKKQVDGIIPEITPVT